MSKRLASWLKWQKDTKLIYANPKVKEIIAELNQAVADIDSLLICADADKETIAELGATIAELKKALTEIRDTRDFINMGSGSDVLSEALMDIIATADKALLEQEKGDE